MIEKIKNVLDRIILISASFLLIILVLGALWQVFSRYVLSNPSTFTNELLGFLLVWTSMLGASYAFGTNQHLALTFIKNKLKGKNEFVITIINDLFIVVFTVLVLIIGGFEAVNITMGQNTPILGISTGLIYSILPISGFLIIFYKLLDIKNYRIPKKVGD
ncbi:TRAP transporter small permease [Oceanobacillus saliphilus]|uniref:TRAP transporter small permease n=1 Tax=Oceanobacillus saliphilus TaxID=2925834 RepID=UPI00201D3D97|nr:TRAP transporter small permease [Oceanobacillus saliphilus]